MPKITVGDSKHHSRSFNGQGRAGKWAFAFFVAAQHCNRRLPRSESRRRRIDKGSTLAKAIFNEGRCRGGHSASVAKITTAKRANLALRPTDTRLDCTKFIKSFDYPLRHWRHGLAEVIRQLGR
ncbi:MAG: sugar nucleotide-binding protein [Sphingomonas sp.]